MNGEGWLKPGDRVRMVGVMPNDPAPIEVGTEGTVTSVPNEGQAIVDWDNGRGLILLREDPWILLENSLAASETEMVMSDTERRKLVEDFTPEQLQKATRGLSLTDYVKAFTAGTNSRRNEDLDLDQRLLRYMRRGAKSSAHEHAFLDGNTWGDDSAESTIRDRIEHPENY